MCPLGKTNPTLGRLVLKHLSDAEHVFAVTVSAQKFLHFFMMLLRTALFTSANLPGAAPERERGSVNTTKLLLPDP